MPQTNPRCNAAIPLMGDVDTVCYQPHLAAVRYLIYYLIGIELVFGTKIPGVVGFRWIVSLREHIRKMRDL